MGLLQINGLILLVTISYYVTGLPGEGQNKHMASVKSNEYQWTNCRHLYQDLHGDMIAVDKENIPREKYYKLVLKVKEALERGLLIRTQKSWSSEPSGKHTEEYRLFDCYNELRLPSIRDYRDATTFFQNSNIHKSPKTPISSKTKRFDRFTEDTGISGSSDSSESRNANSFKNDLVRDMEIDMLAIPLDSVPGKKYYQLVLKVDEAVRRRLISPIKDSYHTGEKGVATNLYTVIGTKEQLILPSIRELRHARLYFDKLEKEPLKIKSQRNEEREAAKVNPLKREPQDSSSESGSESSTYEDYSINKYGAQGVKKELGDDQKISILNRLIFQQQREYRRHGRF